MSARTSKGGGGSMMARPSPMQQGQVYGGADYYKPQIFQQAQQPQNAGPYQVGGAAPQQPQTGFMRQQSPQMAGIGGAYSAYNDPSSKSYQSPFLRPQGGGWSGNPGFMPQRPQGGGWTGDIGFMPQRPRWGASAGQGMNERFGLPGLLSQIGSNSKMFPTQNPEYRQPNAGGLLGNGGDQLSPQNSWFGPGGGAEKYFRQHPDMMNQVYF